MKPKSQFATILKTVGSLPDAPFTLNHVMAALDAQKIVIDNSTVRSYLGSTFVTRGLVTRTVRAAGPHPSVFTRTPAFAPYLAKFEADARALQDRYTLVNKLRVEGLSYREIADRAGIPAGNVGAILGSHTVCQREPLDPPTPLELAWRNFRSTELSLKDDHFYSTETFITNG